MNTTAHFTLQQVMAQSPWMLADRNLLPQAAPDALVDLPWIELLPHGLDKHRDQLPALLRLGALNTEQTQHLTQLLQAATPGLPPAVFLTMQTQADDPGWTLQETNAWSPDTQQDKLTEHLTHYLVLRHPNHQRSLLRYYDSRVFAQLLWMAPPGTLRALFGPITHWQIELTPHTWVSIPRPPPSSSSTAQLTDNTSALMHWIGLINRTWQRLPAQPDLTRYLRTSRSLCELLMRARQTYEQDEASSIDFALEGFHSSPQFDQHPKMAAILAQSKETGAPWGDIVRNTLTPEQRQRIVDEIRQQQAQNTQATQTSSTGTHS